MLQSDSCRGPDAWRLWSAKQDERSSMSELTRWSADDVTPLTEFSLTQHTNSLAKRISYNFRKIVSWKQSAWSGTSRIQSLCFISSSAQTSKRELPLTTTLGITVKLLFILFVLVVRTHQTTAWDNHNGSGIGISKLSGTCTQFNGAYDEITSIPANGTKARGIIDIKESLLACNSSNYQPLH